MKKALAGMWILFLAANALAFSQEIRIQIGSDGFAQAEHKILPEGTEDEEISVPLLDSMATPISVQANGQSVLFEQSNGTIVIANPNSAPEFVLEYSSPSLTSKNKEKWFLELSNLSATISKVTLVLPPESKITRFEPLANVFLQNQGLLAEWNQSALSGHRILLEYELLPPKPAIDFSWILGVALAIVAGAAFFWLKTRKTATAKTAQVPMAQVSDAKSEICRTLGEKEKRIMELVLETDGVTQKQLNQKTGYSKATLSRTLKNLEQRQLLRLVQNGYSNKVFLSEWFKNK